MSISELSGFFDRIQGMPIAKVSLVFERDGRYYQAKFNRLSGHLTIGAELNWSYWCGIIDNRDTQSQTIPLYDGSLTVYVEGKVDDSIFCPSTTKR